MYKDCRIIKIVSEQFSKQKPQYASWGKYGARNALVKN